VRSVLVASIAMTAAGPSCSQAGKHATGPTVQADQEAEAEVVEILSGLRTAEVAFEAVHDHYWPVSLRPRPLGELDGQVVPWVGSGGYEFLGYQPSGPVVGSYMVVLREGGNDFAAHGWTDLDADGVPAQWTAARDQPPTRVTPSHVR